VGARLGKKKWLTPIIIILVFLAPILVYATAYSQNILNALTISTSGAPSDQETPLAPATLSTSGAPSDQETPLAPATLSTSGVLSDQKLLSPKITISTIAYDSESSAPTNDACNSTTLFYLTINGWVNITVTDLNLVADLSTVDIQVSTIGGAESFTLKWTQSTGVFSEVSDASNICTLGSSVRENVDTDTDKIAFQFKFTGGVAGACDVEATTTDDTSASDVDTYSPEFTLVTGTTPIISSSTTTDLDDADNCYAMKKYYAFQTVITDINGATDIQEISVRGTQGATIRWLVNATNLDGVATYNIIMGDQIIDLDAILCSFAEDGDVGTLTLMIRFEWDYAQENDCELEVWASDVGGHTVGWTTAQTNYFDVVTRLVTRDFTGNVTSTTISSPVEITGYIRYALDIASITASTSYPPNTQFTAVKIFDDEPTLQGTDATIVNGFFNVTVTTPASLGSVLYYAYLDLVPDYTDAYAVDADSVAISILPEFAIPSQISQGFTLFGVDLAQVYLTITAFTGWFTQSATAIRDMVVGLFTLIFYLAGTITSWVTRVATFFVALFTAINNVAHGTGGGTDWFAAFNVSAWIDVIPVFAFIIWFDGLSRRARRMGVGALEVAIRDLQVASYIIGEIWNWSFTVFNFVVNMILTFVGIFVP